MPLLMTLTIIVITGFQVYWIQKSYDREQRTLEMRTNILFRETVRGLQASKLKLDKIFSDSTNKLFVGTTLRTRHRGDQNRLTNDQKTARMMDVLMQKARDSQTTQIIIKGGKDSLQVINNGVSPRQNRIMQFLFDVDSLQDSIKVKEVEVAYEQKLKDQNYLVPFTVTRVPTKESDQPVFNEVTVGFKNPITYKLELGNTFPFLLKRITAPILFSVFLVGFTLLSFTLLYRNLIRQRKLADIKNEFISNITHELKTPIATVSVAIEALRNFGGSINPDRTKEYLDISANELLRLSLLVDKVLKLSMFEKKEIDLKYEPLDMKALVDEVNASMRLQFEKTKTAVHVTSEGDTHLQGDRLHLVSVIFNLLDNAIKYSNGSPAVDISVKGNGNKVMLAVADNGIGISPEYHGRIFEKFFRVPTGNLHNAKGYGLGLSYVAHVIEKHHGTIKVESSDGNGTRFLISIPKQQA